MDQIGTGRTLQSVLQIDSCFSRISAFIGKQPETIIPQKRKTFTDKEHEILHQTIQQQSLGEDRYAKSSTGFP